MSDLQAISFENWWSNLCALAVDEVAQCREGNTCAANRAS